MSRCPFPKVSSYLRIRAEMERHGSELSFLQFFLQLIADQPNLPNLLETMSTYVNYVYEYGFLHLGNSPEPRMHLGYHLFVITGDGMFLRLRLEKELSLIKNRLRSTWWFAMCLGCPAGDGWQCLDYFLIFKPFSNLAQDFLVYIRLYLCSIHIFRVSSVMENCNIFLFFSVVYPTLA